METSEISTLLSPADQLNSLPIEERAKAVNHDIDGINHFIDNTEELAKDDPEYPGEKLERAQALKDLMPILTASAEYIKRPDQSHQVDLSSVEAPLETLLKAFSVENDIQEQLMVDGFLTVAIVNLLLNAHKHRDPEAPIKAELCPEGLVIENDSAEPLPDHLYDPGVKGSRGGSGLGLFIAKIYAQLEDRSINHDCQAKNDGKFKVKATITL